MKQYGFRKNPEDYTKMVIRAGILVFLIGIPVSFVFTGITIGVFVGSLIAFTAMLSMPYNYIEVDKNGS